MTVLAMGRTTESHRFPRIAILALLFSLVLAGSAVSAPSLDSRFGRDGLAVASMPASERQSIFDSSQGPLISDLALTPGGGFAAAVGSAAEISYFGAAMFRARGSLDRRFGRDGFVQPEDFFPGFGFGFPGLGFAPQATGVAVQRNGKVLLVGYRTGGIFDRPGPILMRLRPNGSPDTSFGRRGLIAPKPGGKVPPDMLHAVAVQPGGRIIAVGVRKRKGGRPGGVVVAYRRDGRLDRDFGKGGHVLFYGGEGFTGLFDLALLPGGKILLAGYRGNRLFVARLRANGRLDRSFGNNGSVSLDVGLGDGCCPAAASVAALRDGGSVVATSGSGDVLMVRRRPNGALDRGFGRHGLVRGNQRSPSVRDVAVQGNGRIVLVGVDARHGRLNFVVQRFRRDGALDRGFGKHGTETLSLGRSSFGTSAVSLPNGQVVVGGGAQYRRNDRFEYSLVLPRLN
jgi:uncharacterized delta-60 repeat protein